MSGGELPQNFDAAIVVQEGMELMIAYKLFRVRRDGTLGPLFIGRDIVVPVGKWVKARSIRTKGFKFRPGWHCCQLPHAPHLSEKGRIWCTVVVKGVTKHQRPSSQGGLWYTAKHLKVLARG